ncbi:unnamed protein product [Ambrosiozyma monospora]|uniref:Unnamed protein product n=1 Tax=Ambrosiozyma monospora TaxID=43982 RepID=A0A9W7DGF1_AMBMO|nr:unnamed protein product [Ambrosiozyma monospora]
MSSDSIEKKSDSPIDDNIAPVIAGTSDVERVEAPITIKAYLMCCFASFGGILFGYDSGYISGVMGMDYFIHEFTNKVKGTMPDDQFVLASWQKSLITSILSAGTFFGAIIAGDLADWIGRRPVIISGCGIFMVGVIFQVASTTIAMIAVESQRCHCLRLSILCHHWFAIGFLC